MIEYKTLPIEIKAVDLEEGEFEAYAAAFDNVDLTNDVIRAGAFKKTLRERGKKIKLLWQHDLDKPLGLPAKIREDDTGLHVKAKISDTTLGRDVLTLMRDGVIDEMSIGYEAIKHNVIKVKGKEVRELTEIKLWEISLVTIAANPEAQVVNVKELEELELKEAIPYSKGPLAPEDTPWDAAAERAKCETPEELRKICAMVDGDPEVRGSYKLPHHKGDGNYATVWNGVKAAMGALGGARGGVEGGGQSGARGHIAKHYRDFGKPLPGEEGDEEAPADEERPTRERRDFEPAADQKEATAVTEPSLEETLKKKVGLKLKYLEPFVED